MFVLLERASTIQKFGLLARKNGKYTRPILGNLVDFRVEDFMPKAVLAKLLSPHFIGKLPDIPEIGQINCYFVATYNVVTSATQAEAEQKLRDGKHILLPHEPSSEFWKYTNAPWWEFAIVLDEYDGFIKAPFYPRINEPSAEEADERIDMHVENRGKIRVLASSTFKLWALQGVQKD